MADNEKLSVGGFLFYTERDAQLAAVELKKMEYLEARSLILYVTPTDKRSQS